MAQNKYFAIAGQASKALGFFRASFSALLGPQFARESAFYKVIFFLLALPLTLPFIYVLNLLYWRFIAVHFFFPTFTKTIIFQMIVEAALILYLLLIIREKKFAPYLTVTHLLLIALGAVLVISSRFSLDFNASFFSNAERSDGLILLFHAGVYLFLLSWLIKDRIRWEFLLKFAVFFGIATVLLIAILPFVLPNREAARWREIMVLTLGNINFFGHYFFLLTIANSYFIITRPRAWNWIAFCILFFFIIWSQQFSAMILSGVLLAGLLWFRYRAVFYAIALAGSGLGLYISVKYSLRAAFLFNSFFDSFEIRWKVWRDAVKTVLLNSPAAGYGWGNNELLWNFAARDSFTVYGAQTQQVYDKMHNIAIEFLAAAGIVGLVMFAIVAGRFLYVSLAEFLKTRKRVWIFFLTAFFLQLAYLLFNFDTLLSYILTSIFIAGFIVSCKERRYYISGRNAGGMLAALLIVGASGFSLYHYNAKPLKMYSLVRRLDQRIAEENLRVNPRIQEILALVDQAIAINQPYNLLQGDIADMLYKIAERMPLGAEERKQLHDRSRSIYKALTEKHPFNPYYHYNFARTELMFAQNVKSAEIHLSEALRLAPTKGVFKLQLMFAYIHINELESARGFLLQLLEDNFFPGVPEFYLGYVDFKEGKIEEGKRRVVKSLAIHNPSIFAWRDLTRAYLEYGDKEGLLNWYRRLLALPPRLDAELYPILNAELYTIAIQLALELDYKDVAEQINNQFKEEGYTAVLEKTPRGTEVRSKVIN